MKIITINVYESLLQSYSVSFEEIITILKALGNEKRLQILLFLLNGPQSYGAIVEEIALKKTAVSNHLSQLLEVNLIQREGSGVYEITGDGIQFIRAIESAYQKSPTRQLEKFEALEKRGISESFLKRFNR